MPKAKPIQYVVDDNGCHICTSHAPCQDGYPMFNQEKGTRYIYKYIYMVHHGEIPEGLLVRHKCDNRMCINPEHLELGTVKDNSMDMVVRGRSLKGSKNASSRLTEEQVRRIKQDTNSTTAALARQYGVGESTIRRIRQGTHWRHVVA